jgi:hypothetical protein
MAREDRLPTRKEIADSVRSGWLRSCSAPVEKLIDRRNPSPARSISSDIPTHAVDFSVNLGTEDLSKPRL